ncbi:hypothetical protein SNEBB_000528 [Seison nebaliae]|nr:hypothetical protein SNEBB_000528 [Seison nebaliae]
MGLVESVNTDRRLNTGPIIKRLIRLYDILPWENPLFETSFGYCALGLMKDLHHRWCEISERVERCLRIMDAMKDKRDGKVRRLNLVIIEAFRVRKYIWSLYRMEKDNTKKLVETLGKTEKNLKRAEDNLQLINQFLGESYDDENLKEIEDETTSNTPSVCCKKSIIKTDDLHNISGFVENDLKREDEERKVGPTNDGFAKKHESTKLECPIAKYKIMVDIPISLIKQIFFFLRQPQPIPIELQRLFQLYYGKKNEYLWTLT